MWRQRLQPQPLFLFSQDSVVAMCPLLHRPGLLQAVRADNCAYSWQVPKEVCFVLCLVPPPAPAFSYCQAVSFSAKTSIEAILRQTDLKSRQQRSVLLCSMSRPPLQLNHSLSKLLHRCAISHHHHLTTPMHPTHSPIPLHLPPYKVGRYMDDVREWGTFGPVNPINTTGFRRD